MNQNIIEKAIVFATNAHMGQVRKSEPSIPYIMHPIAVANMLMEYGADENVIAAAALHDVVEDTEYTLEDIKENFGADIAHLVECASEMDKTKSWEERKKEKIEAMRDKTLREKLIPTADKIHNIESLKRIFDKKGYKDFSSFKRGEEKQEWYFRGIYKSLVYGENKNNPLFKRLENSINDVFDRTMEEYKNKQENKEEENVR